MPPNPPTWLVSLCMTACGFLGFVAVLFAAFWLLGKAFDKLVDLWALGRYFKDYVWQRAVQDREKQEGKKNG